LAASGPDSAAARLDLAPPAFNSASPTFNLAPPALDSAPSALNLASPTPQLGLADTQLGPARHKSALRAHMDCGDGESPLFYRVIGTFCFGFMTIFPDSSRMLATTVDWPMTLGGRFPRVVTYTREIADIADLTE
jgi:hypothetical protein